jgi:serine/threonine protein kinase
LPDDAPFPCGHKVADRFELKEFLGAGPVGWVYRAEDRDVGGDLALKLIRPRLLQTGIEQQTFLRAIKLARQFSHPQLARVYEQGESEGHLYFTQPNLGGRTLRAVIDAKAEIGQPFSLREALPLLGQVASALTAAHAVGVHGDVKPENIFVLPDALRLTDFGLAIGIPREPFLRAQRTYHHEAYFSPEYIAGAEIDIRADVYSFGVLLGELLGNVVPEGSIPSLRHANPDLPLAVNGLYRRALTESRDGRPPSIQLMMEELVKLAANLDRAASFDFPPAPSPVGPLAALGEEREPLPPPVPELSSDGSEPSEVSMRPGSSGGPSIRQETEVVSPEELRVEIGRQLSPAAAAVSDRRPTAQWPRPDVAPTMERPLSPPVAARRRGRRSHSLAVLLWIALAGLGLGAGGGWILLEHWRTRALSSTVEESEPTPPAVSIEPGRGAMNHAPPRGPAASGGNEAVGSSAESADPAPAKRSDEASGEPSGRAGDSVPQNGEVQVREEPAVDNPRDGSSARGREEALARAVSREPETPAVADPQVAADAKNAQDLSTYLHQTQAAANARVAGKAATQ